MLQHVPIGYIFLKTYILLQLCVQICNKQAEQKQWRTSKGKPNDQKK